MREIFPVKLYEDQEFVEHKLEINDSDLEEIIGEYLSRHAKFDFDELEVTNNCPVNIWLYAKCRKYLYLYPDASEKEQETEAAKLGAEVSVSGPYDDNPTGRCGRLLAPRGADSLLLVTPRRPVCLPLRHSWLAG
jgi:hypothetical protein